MVPGVCCVLRVIAVLRVVDVFVDDVIYVFLWLFGGVCCCCCVCGVVCWCVFCVLLCVVVVCWFLIDVGAGVVC